MMFSSVISYATNVRNLVIIFLFIFNMENITKNYELHTRSTEDLS